MLPGKTMFLVLMLCDFIFFCRFSPALTAASAVLLANSIQQIGKYFFTAFRRVRVERTLNCQ